MEECTAQAEGKFEEIVRRSNSLAVESNRIFQRLDATYSFMFGGDPGVLGKDIDEEQCGLCHKVVGDLRSIDETFADMHEILNKIEQQGITNNPDKPTVSI